jgi:hypothetical protein
MLCKPSAPFATQGPGWPFCGLLRRLLRILAFCGKTRQLSSMDPVDYCHSPDVHGGGVARLTQHLLLHCRQGDQFVRSWSEVEDSIGAGARYGVHGGIHEAHPRTSTLQMWSPKKPYLLALLFFYSVSIIWFPLSNLFSFFSFPSWFSLH